MSVPSPREAIERVSAAISADPTKGRAKNAPATARLTTGLQCELSGPYNERLITDMPQAMGGAASGPNPGWLLRGALASCTATVIAMRAAKLGVALSSLEVTVESESDNRGILGLDENVSAGLVARQTHPLQALRGRGRSGSSSLPSAMAHGREQGLGGNRHFSSRRRWEGR